MKQGKSIVELATEIQRQADAKADYVVDTREMALDPFTLDLNIGSEIKTPLATIAHRQIGTHVGIPAAYYDRMLTQAPALLAGNVNHWWHNQPARRTIRTLDGNTRAYLSDRYRRIDNDEIAEIVLPILLESGDIRVISSEITDRRMYITAVFPKLEREIITKAGVGRPVQAGITISNSEIGLGQFNVSPLIYELVCTNGMITSHALKKYHVGRRAESEDGSYEIFSDETRKADDKALMLKVRDVVRSSMNEASFAHQVNVLQEATRTEEIIAPVAAIEVLTKRNKITGEEGNSVLTNLIKGGDLTKYGLAQAVTEVANTDQVSYDRAVELHQLGGSIIDLNRSEWKNIAEAA